MGAALSRRNDTLSYYTVKNVQVRDWRLGAVYYVCVVCAVAYVLADVILLNKSFLVFEPVVGVVRLDLTSPLDGDLRSGFASLLGSGFAYCRGRQRNMPFLVRGRTTEYPGFAGGSDGPAMFAQHWRNKRDGQIGCSAMDGHDLVFPPHEEAAIFITTTLLELEQRRASPSIPFESGTVAGTFPFLSSEPGTIAGTVRDSVGTITGTSPSDISTGNSDTGIGKLPQPGTVRDGAGKLPQLGTVRDGAGGGEGEDAGDSKDEKYLKDGVGELPSSESIEWQTERFRDNYAVGVESAELTLGHMIFSHSSSDMNGRLLNSKGEVLGRFARGATPSIRVDELLAAAGVSLNDRAVTHGGNGSSATILTRRDTGVVLALMIEYSNTQKTLLPQSDPEWAMTAVLMDEDEFSVDEVTRDSHEPGLRTVRHRVGIRVKAFQTGSIGVFSLNKLLLSLAAGLVIIGTARAAVDMLAVFVLADRDRYRSYIYELTETLDEVEERQRSQADKQHQAVGVIFETRARAARNGNSYALLEEGNGISNGICSGMADRGGSWLGGGRCSCLGGGSWLPWGKSSAIVRQEELQRGAMEWAARQIQREWRHYGRRLLNRNLRSPVPPSAGCVASFGFLSGGFRNSNTTPRGTATSPRRASRSPAPAHARDRTSPAARSARARTPSSADSDLKSGVADLRGNTRVPCAGSAASPSRAQTSYTRGTVSQHAHRAPSATRV